MCLLTTLIYQANCTPPPRSIMWENLATFKTKSHLLDLINKISVEVVNWPEYFIHLRGDDLGSKFSDV